MVIKPSLENFLNTRFGTSLGLSLSRMQPGLGYRMADFIGSMISSMKKTPFVRAVRANQWVIHGGQLSSLELDRLVGTIFKNAARSLYEFWHFHTDPSAVRQMVDIDPSLTACFQRAQQDQTGLLMVVPHTGNFDLIGQAVALSGYQLHVLSYPQPNAAYVLQNSLRLQPGMKVTPLCINALRLASDTLRTGGVVVTGIDRPLPVRQSKYPVRFFSRLAAMPVFHVRLALKHDLPVIVLGGKRKKDGRYIVWASKPVPMVRQKHLVPETIQNAENVLALLAENIFKAADQWSMFYPVWPEAQDQMPG